MEGPLLSCMSTYLLFKELAEQPISLIQELFLLYETNGKCASTHSTQWTDKASFSKFQKEANAKSSYYDLGYCDKGHDDVRLDLKNQLDRLRDGRRSWVCCNQLVVVCGGCLAAVLHADVRQSE
ncbi:hypothetical protein R6Q57_024268 [Mikania cordata]